MERKSRERYRVEFKVRALAALDANGGKIYTTSRLLKVPRTTLRDWYKHRDEIHVELEKQQRQRRLMLEDRFEAAVDQIVNLLPEKIEAMKPLESIHALKLMMSLNAEIAAKNVADAENEEDLYETLVRLVQQLHEQEAADAEKSLASTTAEATEIS